jgi:hypothetical protein
LADIVVWVVNEAQGLASLTLVVLEHVLVINVHIERLEKVGSNGEEPVLRGRMPDTGPLPPFIR